MTPLKGIGIDLIELTRLRRFLKSHPFKNCERLLTESEKKRWRTEKQSAVFFSKLIAAKEAFFKARGGNWMGFEGFGSYEVECLGHEQFQVRDLHLKNQPLRAQGQFFETSEWVGAQVVLWG